MADVYLTSNPKKADFPEHVPGLYILSKGEILDDLDYISSCVQADTNTSSRGDITASDTLPVTIL